MNNQESKFLTFLISKTNQSSKPHIFKKQGAEIRIKQHQVFITYPILARSCDASERQARSFIKKHTGRIFTREIIMNSFNRPIGSLLTFVSGQNIPILSQKVENMSGQMSDKSINYKNKQQEDVFFERMNELYELNGKLMKEIKKLRENQKPKNWTEPSERNTKVFTIKLSDQVRYVRMMDYLSQFESMTPYEKNGIWMKFHKDDSYFWDLVEYMELREKKGKVRDRLKFLVQGIKRRYDLSEIHEMREQERSIEERWAEAEQARQHRIEQAERERTKREQERIDQEIRQKQELEVIQVWLQEENHEEFFENIIKETQTNAFFSRLISQKAKKHGMETIQFMKSIQAVQIWKTLGVYQEILNLAQRNTPMRGLNQPRDPIPISHQKTAQTIQKTPSESLDVVVTRQNNQNTENYIPFCPYLITLLTYNAYNLHYTKRWGGDCFSGENDIKFVTSDSGCDHMDSRENILVMTKLSRKLQYIKLRGMANYILCSVHQQNMEQ